MSAIEWQRQLLQEETELAALRHSEREMWADARPMIRKPMRLPLGPMRDHSQEVPWHVVRLRFDKRCSVCGKWMRVGRVPKAMKDPIPARGKHRRWKHLTC